MFFSYYFTHSVIIELFNNKTNNLSLEIKKRETIDFIEAAQYSETDSYFELENLTFALESCSF